MVLGLVWESLEVDIASSEFEILSHVVLNETQLDFGGHDNGCVNEGGIEKLC